jgi:diguanylate cyclase (GGDEF)-like protein
VAEREFPRIETLPKTPEFRRVAEAMNLMTGSVEKIITEQSEQARRLQAEAYRDTVTGLRNRRALGMDIEQLARDVGQHGPGALMLVNVRGLESINQDGGYERGDAFMHALGQTLEQRMDSLPAAVGRWGGAIFAVVLREASRDGVIGLAQEVITDMQRLSVEGDQAESVNVGLVFHSGADDAETLAEKCEAALRHAEDAGPGTWHLWQASETVATGELRDEADWEVRLKRIVAQGDVVLESQSVVGGDGEEIHREVLARFRDDDGELVPAGRFIPVAVRLGLGSSLDVVILEQVLGVLATRFQTGERLAVNLSVTAAGDEDFRRWLHNRLSKEPRTRRERLCVEVPEHFAASDPAGMRALLDAVRPLGVSVGVDHCGSGDVSLSALRGLPLDYAKLYGGFVKGIDDDRERQALLRSFVSIGHGMGIAMVAEFVETEAELTAVKELGFDAVQGYLVGRPAAMD